MNKNLERIYLVYQDLSFPGNSDCGKSQHVIAKNRKEAWTKVNFKATHVSYRPWLKNIDGFAVDSHGEIYGDIITNEKRD